MRVRLTDTGKTGSGDSPSDIMGIMSVKNQVEQTFSVFS